VDGRTEGPRQSGDFTMTILRAALAAGLLATTSAAALAQSSVKIGLITTLSGPEGVLGATESDARL